MTTLATIRGSDPGIKKKVMAPARSLLLIKLLLIVSAHHVFKQFAYFFIVIVQLEIGLLNGPFGGPIGTCRTKQPRDYHHNHPDDPPWRRLACRFGRDH